LCGDACCAGLYPVWGTGAVFRGASGCEQISPACWQAALANLLMDGIYEVLQCARIAAALCCSWREAIGPLPELACRRLQLSLPVYVRDGC
jgi:hypothetical protein